MTKKFLNSKTIVALLLCTIILLSMLMAFGINQTTVSAESLDQGISPYYADNVSKEFIFSDGTRVHLDFIGKDVLWPFADEVKVQISSDNTSNITYDFILYITQREGNITNVDDYNKAYGTLGGGFNSTYLGRNYTCNGVNYKKWNIINAKVDITITHYGQSINQVVEIIYA